MADTTVLSKLSDLAEKPLKAVKKEIKNDFEAVTEQVGVKLPQKQTPEEASETRKMVQGFYAGGENMSQAEFQQKLAQSQEETSEGVSKILEELHGNKAPQTPNKQSAPQEGNSERLKAMLHREQVADILEKDEAPTPEQMDRKRREQIKLQEEKAEEEKKKAQLENIIEAPAGKVTGMPGKRRRTPMRMQPPKTSENRAGHGVGG